ncbi:MAG: NnrU family protein [Porticoccaceae bacterium]|jgi:uncharacterized membrane protein|nr:NnrU family protein [Porticoccaceae bacterium]
MSYLILGLILFLGTHSIRVFADGWRSQMIAKLGLLPWKGLYALVSLVGFILLVWGYGQARLDPVWLWHSPLWVRHLVGLLMLPALILAGASHISGSAIRAKVGHPLIAATKLWAGAHLIANGALADLVLFGSFLVWSMIAFRSARRRDKAANLPTPVTSLRWDALAVIIGTALWLVFAFYLHKPLFGVSSMG